MKQLTLEEIKAINEVKRCAQLILTLTKQGKSQAEMIMEVIEKYHPRIVSIALQWLARETEKLDKSKRG